MRRFGLFLVFLSLLLATAPVRGATSASALPTPTALVDLILLESERPNHRSEISQLRDALDAVAGPLDYGLMHPVMLRMEALVHGEEDLAEKFYFLDQIANDYWFALDDANARQIVNRMMTLTENLSEKELQALGPESIDMISTLGLWHRQFLNADQAAAQYLTMDDLLSEDTSPRMLDWRSEAVTYLAGLGMIDRVERLQVDFDRAIHAATTTALREWLERERAKARARTAAALNPSSEIPTILATLEQLIPDPAIRDNFVIDLTSDALFRGDSETVDILIRHIETVILQVPDPGGYESYAGNVVFLFDALDHCPGFSEIVRFQREVREADGDSAKIRAPGKQEVIPGPADEDEDRIILTHTPAPSEILTVLGLARCDEPTLLDEALHAVLEVDPHLFGFDVFQIYSTVPAEQISADWAERALELRQASHSLDGFDPIAADSEEDVLEILTRALLLKTSGDSDAASAELQAAWAHIQTLAPGSRSEELALLAFALTV